MGILFLSYNGELRINMEVFEEYLSSIENEVHRTKLREVLSWVKNTFPTLESKIAWNQPMFTDHGTFILGFSASKAHFAVSPEAHSIAVFLDDIAKSGYTQSSNLFRIKWDEAVDYNLLECIIQYNIDDKKDCTTFWRK